MAINAEQLNIILSARDKEFTKAMERNQRRVEQFARKSQTNLSKAGRSFDALGRAARALAPVLAAAFSVQAISRLTAGASEIGKLAAVASTSVEEFQRFAAGARTVGIEMAQASDIIKDVNDRIGDFLSTGGGPMVDFFENIAPQVGVTAKQFANLSGPQALQLYVRSLEQANLSQAEMTFYMEALANDATALLPVMRNNGEAMRRFGDEAQSSGRILSADAVDGARELEREAQELADTINTALTSAILENKEELMALVTFITDTAIPAFGRIIGAIAKAGELYGSFTGEGPTGLPAAPSRADADAAVAGANALGGGDPSNTGLFFYNPATGRVEPYGANTPSIGGVTAPRIPVTPANDLFQNFVRGSDITHTAEGRGILRRSRGGGGGDAIDEVENLRRAYLDLIASIDEAAALSQEYDRQQGVLNDALASGAITSEEYAAGMEATAQAYRDAQFEASELGQVMQTVESSMENAFMSMIDGTASAKDAFRSMAQDIIRELYRVLVVQQLVGQFQTGGGGILGALAPMFGRASGGPVMAGRPYMVGEHGREPFIPAENGRILSTAQAKDAMSGGSGPSITINYSFQGGVTQADLGRALPVLVENTKRSVIDAVQRGGATARAFK